MMIINIFKSNRVRYRMEMGQEVQNPGLNPGITNKGMLNKSTTTVSVETWRNTKIPRIHHTNVTFAFMHSGTIGSE